MSLTDIKKTLEKLTVDIDAIADPHVAAVQRTLFSLVEVLVEVNAAQGKTIQQLKDEVNRLKGEQGKPDIRKQKIGADAVDPKHSSEADRKKRSDQKPRAKKPKRKKPLRSIGGSIATLIKAACHLMQSSKGMRREWCRILKSSQTTLSLGWPFIIPSH